MLKNRRKRVLHILNSNSFSGAENVAVSIISYLGKEFDFAYMSPAGDIKTALDKRHIKSFLVPRLSVRCIRAAVKKFQPDIIHAHDFTAGVLAASAFTKVPVINHLHNNSPWLKKPGLYSFVYLSSVHGYRQILTVSDSVMGEYVFGKYVKEKTTVVGNPVDISIVREKAQRADLCDQSDVAFFGRITRQKNPELFLEIMRLLADKNSRIQGIMIGEGELRSRIEDRISAMHLSDNIKLYGFLENPFGLIKNTKVVCMPSLWEGFGLAAAESLALGRPVVAARVGGLPNIVDAQCGDFCESAQDYAETIYRYLTSRELMEQKSRGAEKKALELDNMHDYMRTMKAVYLQVGNEKSNRY